METPTMDIINVQRHQSLLCSADDSVDSVHDFELGLHIAALVGILLTSAFGVLFPIVANRTRVLRVPPLVFFSVKHFGTGVIIATAFIHLLPSAFENLTSHCLPPFFTDEYPSFAGLIAMTAMLIIFFVEFGSSRYLAKVDKKIMQMQLCDPTNQNSLVQPVKSLLIRRNVVVNGRLVNIDPTMAGEAADRVTETLIRETSPDEESPLLNNEEGRKPHHDSHCGHHHYDPPPVDGHGSLNDVTRKSQLLGVAILEGGLCFHSIFVGLTLAVATGGGFISLLIAIMFHQTFEGLGLGARIATLSFPRKSIRPYLMGMIFVIVTPVGMAIGLSIRTLYSPSSPAALITTGIFDAISAGLLIYASLVELLAHEFLMGDMRFEGIGKVILAGFCIIAGAAMMSLVGLWA